LIHRAVRRTGIHLIRLCLIIEHALPARHANAAVLAAGQRKDDYWWLEPPAFKGAITVAGFHEVMAVEDHRAVLRRWAESAWQAWAEHHDTIRQWLPAEWKGHQAFGSQARRRLCRLELPIQMGMIRP